MSDHEHDIDKYTDIKQSMVFNVAANNIPTPNELATRSGRTTVVPRDTYVHYLMFGGATRQEKLVFADFLRALPLPTQEVSRFLEEETAFGRCPLLDKGRLLDIGYCLEAAVHHYERGIENEAMLALEVANPQPLPQDHPHNPFNLLNANTPGFAEGLRDNRVRELLHMEESAPF